MIGRLLSRPAALRWLGAFGSVCCAIDGFLFGAPPQMRLGVSVASILRGPHGVLILLLWTVGLGALCGAWWYGHRLVGRGVLSTRWVLVTAALWVAPMLVVPPLASRDLYAYACQGASVAAGLNPYAHPIADLPCPWLESVSPVWRDTPAPYGPVFLLLAGAAAAPGALTVALAVLRVLAVLALAPLAAGVAVLARRVEVPVDRALWWAVCSPLVAVHLVGGAHNDGLAVALLAAGLAVLAGSENGAGARPAGFERRLGGWLTGGVLLGLAVEVKASLAVVLPFAVLLAAGGPELFPAGRRWPPVSSLAALARRGGVILAGVLATVAGSSVASGLGFGWLGALSGTASSVSWTSPPTAVGLAVDAVTGWFGAPAGAVPVTRVVAVALLPVVLVAIAWRTRRASPLYGAGLACLALALLAPITQPWYLMWPAVLLGATSARARWLAVAIVAAMFTILPDGDGAFKPLQVPLAFAMTGLAGWATFRFVRWLRSEAADDGSRYPKPVTGSPMKI